MTGLSVLSFGSTRGLWDGPGAEDYQRMMGYAEHLDRYVVVANSYKRHGLKRQNFGPRVEAIPTNAFCPFDSLLRMLHIGRSVLRSRPVSLIQAQDPFYIGAVAVLLGKRFHVPVNICLYGPNVYDDHWLASHWSHRWLAKLGRWVLRRCQGIQVDGQLTADRLIAAGVPPARVAVKKMVPANLDEFLQIKRPAPLTCVLSPADGGEELLSAAASGFRNRILSPADGGEELPLSRLRERDRVRAVSDKPVHLLFVGRLVAQKNLPLLLDVVKRLPGNFELTLVGEGPEEKSLHALANGDGRVKFRGPVPRDQIAGVFADADVFVLTSDFEGYPRVLMEAAAAALPIVTTAVSGANEAVVDGRTGFIVPVGDGQALTEKLAQVTPQMGLAGREHIRTQLDPRTNAPGQVAIWHKLAKPRLLLFNLTTDSKDPVLGFTTLWIRALAAQAEHIHVITMYAGTIDVPANVTVHSAGREHGWSKLRRMLRFYRLLFRVLRTERIDGCFSHMNQIFSMLGGPVLRLAGIPLVTWYAHPSLTPGLKLAHFFSNRIVTSLPNAYPYRKNKVAVIGQGIDTALYAPGGQASDDEILCVGRLSRVKNHPTLIKAVKQLKRPARLVILGAVGEEDYAAELRQLGGPVTFAKPVAPTELPACYQRCAVHVNLTPAGFGDKVAWEAMSCGRPCLVFNEDFRETLGRYADDLLFRDADDLAAKLDRLLAMTPAQRDEVGLYLRQQVQQLHSLPKLAERILEQLAVCRARCPVSFRGIAPAAEATPTARYLNDRHRAPQTPH